VPEALPATIDIDPNTLQTKSNGQFMTAYIELPEPFGVADIDPSTVMLNGTIAAEVNPTAIGDHDNDGISDLMVKFDRQALIDHLAGKTGQVKLTVEGKVGGSVFQGADTISVK
jgi:hypothetical protein